MITPTSTGTCSAWACPVTRSTRRSAMSLATTARVPLGDDAVGVPRECGVGGDALGPRQQRAESGHRVRRRPQAHPPLVLGVLQPVDEAVRIEAVGQLLRLVLH